MKKKDIAFVKQLIKEQIAEETDKRSKELELPIGEYPGIEKIDNRVFIYWRRFKNSDVLDRINGHIKINIENINIFGHRFPKWFKTSEIIFYDTPESKYKNQREKIEKCLIAENEKMTKELDV